MESYALTEFPIEMKHGSTFILPFYYRDTGGNVIDLSNYTAKMHVRRTSEAAGDPDIVLTTENGGLTIDGTNGLITVQILRAETVNLAQDYSGRWDLYLIPTEATAFCLVGGPFTIYPSVTRPLT